MELYLRVFLFLKHKKNQRWHSFQEIEFIEPEKLFPTQTPLQIFLLCSFLAFVMKFRPISLTFFRPSIKQ